MEFRKIFFAAVSIGLLFVSADAQTSDDWKNFSWLTGCWKSTTNGISEECWMQPLGGSMQGSARTIIKEKTVSREFFAVMKTAEGFVYRVQTFSGAFNRSQDIVSFPAVKVSESEIIFENPKHDFPQRIIYRRLTKKTALAKIQLMDGTKTIEYPLARMKMN